MGCHSAAGGWRIRRRSNWVHRTFPMRRAAKSSIYRNEVTSYALEAVLEAIAAIEAGHEAPAPMASDDPRIRVRGPCRQADRAIDWQHDTTVEVLRKIDSADGMPGLTDSLFWQDVRLFDAHEAHGISGEPGTVVAQCDGALARGDRRRRGLDRPRPECRAEELETCGDEDLRVGSRASAAQARMRLRSDRIVASIARLASCNSTSTTAP